MLGQYQRQADSLRNLIASAPEDTNKVNLQMKLTWIVMHNEPEKATTISNEALALATKLDWKKGMGTCYSYRGFIYENTADNTHAMECYLKGLKIFEEINYTQGKAIAYSNIGVLYGNLGDNKNALIYYFKSYEILKSSGNKYRIAVVLCNIGTRYNEMKQYDKALEYCNQSLGLFKEIDNKTGIATLLLNVGEALSNKNDDKAAMPYLKESLKTWKEVDSKHDIAQTLISLANSQIILGQLADAKQNLDTAFKYVKEVSAVDLESQAWAKQSQLLKKQGKGIEALDAFTKYITLRDSLNNLEKQNQLARKDMQFEYDKKETVLKADQEKKEAVSNEEKKRQRIIIYSISFGFVLLLVLALVIFRSLQQNKKQNKIITEQKHLVEEKQKEILDSIHYAKRIQTSLLTNEKYINKTLNRLINEK